MIKIISVEKILEKVIHYFTPSLDNEIDHIKHAIEKDRESSNPALETRNDSIRKPQHERNYQDVYLGMFYW